MQERKRSLPRVLWKQRTLCLMILPAIILLFMFNYLPLYGLTIAFRDFNYRDGIWNSPWIGLKNFRILLVSGKTMLRLVKNTFMYYAVFTALGTICNIALAIMLNEITFMPLKKGIQTLIYIPHFFTWVVVYSVFFVLFGSTGMVNTVIKMLGGEEILFFMKGGWFRFLLVISNAWKGAGWGTIVYLSAITAIDAQIYEAATIDGASKMQQAFRITIPSLLPTLVLMLTVRLGSIMSGGFDQVLAFYNPTVYKSADILGTFVYRQGIGSANFSYASAVGLFESVVGLIFVSMSNVISKRLSGRTVW